MQTMNHTAVFFLKALRVFFKNEENYHIAEVRATKYVEENIPLLLLPDAIRMYGPRQQFHFTEHPTTKKTSGVVFNTTPNNLKGIKELFQANLQSDIPKCVIDEISHPEEFARTNPSWKKTAYMTHLYQDYNWDKEIRSMVDISERFNDIFIYQKNNMIVDGVTFRRHLRELDNLFFIEIAKIIYNEFGVSISEKWFEEHVYRSILREYDKELADNTWQYIQLPSKKATIPDFILKEEIKALVEKMTDLSIMFCF